MLVGPMHVHIRIYSPERIDCRFFFLFFLEGGGARSGGLYKRALRDSSPLAPLVVLDTSPSWESRLRGLWLWCVFWHILYEKLSCEFNLLYTRLVGEKFIRKVQFFPLFFHVCKFTPPQVSRADIYVNIYVYK